jgi:MFS transporter, PPP family, 3-phenylpropionic acid transporter
VSTVPAHPVVRASVLRPSIVYVVLFGSVGAYFPYIAVYFQSIGLSLEVVGLLLGLGSAVGLVAAPAWGAVADWLRDVRGPLVIAGIWAALATLLLASARDPLAVAVGIVLLAAAFSGMGPMLDARTIELVGDDRDRYAWARSTGSASFIVISLGVGALLNRTGPSGLFLAFAPLLALSSLTAWLFLGGGRPPGRRVVGPGPLTGLTAILRDPGLGLFFLGSILVWTSVAMMTSFVSIHLIRLGGDAQLVGLFWALGAAVEVPLMLMFPAFSRRFGPAWLLVIAGLAFAARTALVALAPTPLLVVAAAPIGGVGFAFFYVGTVSYVAQAVPPNVRATAQGIFSGTAFNVGTIVGAVLAGQIGAALTLRGLFLVAAIATILAALVVWRAVIGRGNALADAGSPVGDADLVRRRQ